MTHSAPVHHNGSIVGAETCPREKRVGHGPHGWTDNNRDKAAAVKRSKVQAHDAQAVPIVRDLRARGESWRSIAAYLNLALTLSGMGGSVNLPMTPEDRPFGDELSLAPWAKGAAAIE